MKEGSEQQERESYADLLHKMETQARLEAGAMRHKGYGGILNIISDTNDGDNQRALDIVRDELGVELTDVKHIDVEKIILALELGIKRHQFGIPEETLESQSLAENVFQIAYQGFGKDRKGWRIGSSWLLDSLKEAIEEGRVDLRGTAFEDFLNALDLGDLGGEEGEIHAPRLVVLHFPPLDAKRRLVKASDADPSSLSPGQADRVEKFLHTFSLITQVYPGKFGEEDNPHGDVIVNLIDNSYRWYSARNMRWHNAYEFICDRSVETPRAHYRDKEIFSTLNK